MKLSNANERPGFARKVRSPSFIPKRIPQHGIGDRQMRSARSCGSNVNDTGTNHSLTRSEPALEDWTERDGTCIIASLLRPRTRVKGAGSGRCGCITRPLSTGSLYPQFL